MSRATRLAGMLRAWLRSDVEAPLERRLGGARRLRLVLLLDCVLALDAADKAAVGAVAAELESALHIGNVDVAWLVTASTGVGALLTLPFSVFADRARRTRLLALAMVLWSVAMALASAAPSYVPLLASRLLLGAAAAAAGPAVVSLTGDYFRPGERGRILGYVLAGELVGVAFGYLVLGNVAALASWRAAFAPLAVLGLVLAAVVSRHLPEPPRGGASGVVDAAGSTAPDTLVREVDARAIAPRRDQVLRDDPRAWSLLHAVRYLLSLRTYRALVLASGLGYFYFAGLRTFAVVFLRGRFDLGQATATGVLVALGLGGIAGVLLGGRIADALVARGRIDARVVVGGCAYLLAVAALVPGVLAGSLLVAAPFYCLAAAGIAGANPAVDAARLDVVDAGLWGRAEGVRATLRLLLEAAAPPLFGYVALRFPGTGGASPVGPAVAGLAHALLAMLAALALAGLVLLLRARRTYARDVATAIASRRASAAASPGTRAASA